MEGEKSKGEQSKRRISTFVFPKIRTPSWWKTIVPSSSKSFLPPRMPSFEPKIRTPDWRKTIVPESSNSQSSPHLSFSEHKYMEQYKSMVRLDYAQLNSIEIRG